MSEAERGLGYKPDPEDSRDKLLSASPAFEVSSSPPAWSLRAYWDARHQPELDQGILQGCVGFSTSIGLYTKQRIEVDSAATEPSAGFIWYNSRKTHGDEELNEGTYIREAFKTLKTLGAAPEADWPNDELPSQFGVRPASIAYTHAYDFRFEVDYRRLDAEGEELRSQLKESIYQGCPVVFGITVTKAFTRLKAHGPVPDPAFDEPVAGGHAMCILAYDEYGVRGPNSWGSWGNDGWFYISWEYFLNQSRDRWAIVHAPRIE